MKQSHLALICGCLLVVILAISWCGRKPQPEITSLPTPAQTPSPVSATPFPSPSASAATAQASTKPSPSQTPPPELRKLAGKVGSAVVLVTVFDPSGQLLRTGTGFFVAADGRLVTNMHVVEGGAHAVAKSADGKIRNVTGVVASSPPLDVALLKAETKMGVPFLALSKVSEPEKGTTVAVIGSPLTPREEPLAVALISGQQSDPGEERLEISAPISNYAEGSPVVDTNGEVMGVVTSAGGQNAATASVVRPASTLRSLLTPTKPDTTGHWAGKSPSPSATPASQDNRRLKVLYNPAPRYPTEARFSMSPIRGSGRFRVIFNANGQTKDVQILQSTGRPALDQAAITALRQWKSEPGHEWSVLVPVAFEP
jgi:TonB family protein